MSRFPALGEIFVVKEKGRKRLSHVPFHVVGKHAKKDVRPHVIFGSMPYGTDEKLQALHGPEDPLDLRETLVACARHLQAKASARSLVRMT